MRSWKVWLALVLLSVVSLVMTAAPLEPEHGVNTANLDRTCAPCTDFNQFANGGWDGEKSDSPRLSELGCRECGQRAQP